MAKGAAGSAGGPRLSKTSCQTFSQPEHAIPFPLLRSGKVPASRAARLAKQGFTGHSIRFEAGFAPRKVLRLAERAFAGRYDRETLVKWLKSFYRRFFSQQFKRSCLPDGPKVGSVALSPRGDWRMPSDAVAALWLEELEGLA